MLAVLGLRRQRRTRRRGKGDPAADKLIEGPGFHHAANQAEVEAVTRGQPEHRVIAHQVLVALADAHLNHDPVRHRSQRQTGHRPDFQAAEQHRRTDAERSGLRRFHHDIQAVDIARVADRRILDLKVAARRAASGLNVNIGLEQGVEMLHARGGDLRGDHREAGPGAGKRADVFRIKHGFRLHLVFGGDQLQGLDLTDIDAEIANRHPGRHLPGVERMQGDLAAHGARCRFRSVKDAFVIQPRIGAAAVEVVETDRPFYGAGQRRGLNGESVAVKFNLRAPFRPEDAVVGQQVAVLGLDMQIDIESVFARFDGDDLADGEFTIQHHRASLNVR